MTAKKIPKICVHYNTFDTLCKQSSQSRSDYDRSIVFSASLRRAFITKGGDNSELVRAERDPEDVVLEMCIKAGVWPGDLYEVDREIGTPFTRDGKLTDYAERHFEEEHFETPSSERRYISKCRDLFLCEIEIVDDEKPEDISAVKI